MINPTGGTTLVCLDSNGHFHRLDTTITPLGPRSDLLLAAAGEQGIIVRNIAKLGDMPVHLYASGENPAIAVFLTRLMMRTYYMAQGTGEALCMVPHYAPANAVEFLNEWAPPENCQLAFVYRAGLCYLLAIEDQGEGKQVIRCLPLPNLHANCKICMGNWVNPGGHLLQILDNALTFFCTSMWNRDLEGDTKRGYTSRFMRFTVDGKQMPALDPWTSFSSVAADANYNWVAEI